MILTFHLWELPSDETEYMSHHNLEIEELHFCGIIFYEKMRKFHLKL